jgi:uncharacterized protein YciI
VPLRVRATAAAHLEPLTRLNVERVLVTHGRPVLRNGARELAASLNREPWSRSSFY